MVMTQAIVRALLTSGETDPVRFLTALNYALCGNVKRMGSDKNMTLCLVDYAAGKLKLSGQHEEVIIIRRNGKVELVDTINLGFPVGLEEEISDFIGQKTIRLKRGDGMVLYTDGITEAENMKHEHYGQKRLCKVVQKHWKKSAEAIKKAVVSDVMRYIGKQTVYDDITLVVAKQI
jgi:serine phosphatase RsbU (regulator of sigma subunit)